MHIALIGATGFVGTALLNELLQRGHRVTALARDPAKIPLREGLTVVQADATDAAQVAQAVRGVDAVASAYNPGWTHPDLHDEFLRGSRAITAGVKAAGVQRLLVVGGAGSLYVAPGVQLVDTPTFPDAYKPIALAHREAFKVYQGIDDLDWTFYSPAAEIGPGPQQGGFRTQAKAFLASADGHSRISYADYADAFVNEIETPRYLRQIATVAY